MRGEERRQRSMLIVVNLAYQFGRMIDTHNGHTYLDPRGGNTSAPSNTSIQEPSISPRLADIGDLRDGAFEVPRHN